ncbi:MAG: hypothetical protein NT034_03130 [Candidatus Magasanikbacteria bacterium]|nr:hypothetical protein [Candidatus Magasanikbacteria bacterium]
MFTNMINKKFLIIVLAVLLVLMVGGFVWFKHKNNKIDNTVNFGQTQTVSPEVIQQENQKIKNDSENLQKVLDEKQKTDADLDGLSDSEEKQLGTDPKKIDTDGDGLTDYDEVKIYHTNALKADTDGDGYSDGSELRRGYDPLGPGKLKK